MTGGCNILYYGTQEKKRIFNPSFRTTSTFRLIFLSTPSPDAGGVRLPVGRVLRLAGEDPAVVGPGGGEAEGGDGGEALPVRHQFAHRAHPFGHHPGGAVDPGDLQRGGGGGGGRFRTVLHKVQIWYSQPSFSKVESFDCIYAQFFFFLYVVVPLTRLADAVRIRFPPTKNGDKFLAN